MIPANLQAKLGFFIQRSRKTIKGLIAQIIERGLSPEDQIFVIPAEDLDSQQVTAIMFGLEQRAVGPLVKGFVVNKDDFFAYVGQTFEECEPDICRALHQRNCGQAQVLAVVDGYFCGVSLIYSSS